MQGPLRKLEMQGTSSTQRMNEREKLDKLLSSSWTLNVAMAIQVISLGKCRIKLIFVGFRFLSPFIRAESLRASSQPSIHSYSLENVEVQACGIADMAIQCMLDSQIVWRRANTD